MILFGTVHAVNIKARSLRDYGFITEIDALKDLDFPGDRYKTVHSCKNFTQAIADVEIQKDNFTDSVRAALLLLLLMAA